MEFSLQASDTEIQQAVLCHETIVKWTEGKEIKKFILVKGRIINVVV
jgi:leucyl-tRNA synthetase